MLRVDAHQHYWNPARGDYLWMPMDNPTLARPYDPSHLAGDLETHGIDRTVLVQAAATVEETEYMLGIADATPSVAAVVGWIDFEDPAQISTLIRLAAHPKFAGVRAMIQDIPDDDWMLRKDIQWGFEALVDLDLTFDALGFPRHLANFLTILERYPRMRVVLDHAMKPEVRNHSPAAFRFWADGMARIAAETDAFCKLSGLVTEAGTGWTVEDLKPYARHLFETFGPDRLMWGSDWPVCRLRGEYADWHEAAIKLASDLPEEDRARVFGATAQAFYRF